jgi:hypothetical protein
MRRYSLGRIVCGLLLGPVDDRPGHGRDDEDAPVDFVLNPPLACSLCKQERASEVDVNHPPEVVVWIVFCWSAARDARIGHKDIDRAELFDDGVPCFFHAFFGRSVALVAMDFGLRKTSLLGRIDEGLARLIRAFLFQVNNCAMCTGQCVSCQDLLTETLRCAL